jgi:hypothetical protein
MLILKITIMQKNILYKFSLVAAAATFLLATSCKKFLEPDYKNQVSSDIVFASDANAVAAINGLYIKLGTTVQVNGVLTELSGLASDELTYNYTSIVYPQFINNQLQADNSSLITLWDFLYATIFQANSIIENATASTGMTAAYKQQVIAESKFVRALCHFYLVNLFGPVPVITVTDKDKTVYAPRNTVDEVYAQIKTDLQEAYNDLPADYSVSSGSRIRVNKWGAAALLARVYLYTKDYPNAEAQVNAVLANTGLYSLVSNQNNVFLKNQKESILEWDRTQLAATYEASMFLSYPNFGYAADHAMLPGLINAFETGDTRKTNWLKTYGSYTLPYKYKTTSGNTENYIVLRVAEQYLIRAEARAQQNNISGAQSDINIIRNRSGLANDTTMVNNATAMAAIEKERRVELFCEWGHRWFDLKRWPSLTSPTTKTRADDVLGTLKTTWKSTAVLWPIPQVNRDRNTNLTQNAGY